MPLGDQIRNVLEYKSDDFLELVKIAGLNPKSDFRYISLSGLNFFYMDLSGFDFTGSDLSNCSFHMALIDKVEFDDEQLKNPKILEAISWSKSKRIPILNGKEENPFRMFTDISNHQEQSIVNDYRFEYQLYDAVFHPKQGMGHILKIGIEIIAGFEIDAFTIDFGHMILILPNKKIDSSNIINISREPLFLEVLSILSGSKNENEYLNFCVNELTETNSIKAFYRFGRALYRFESTFYEGKFTDE